MNKEIKIKTVDGIKIACAHTTSKAKGVVLWLHGITVNKDEYLGFFKDGAETLATAGIDSLRIDFRGHGDSDGSSLDFSIIGQMLDVEAAIQYLTEYYKGRLNLFIVGCSFGAPPALFATERYLNIVKGVVLIAPVLSYKRTFLQPETDWAKSIFNRKAFRVLQRTNKLYINPEFPVSSRLVEEMKLIKPEATLQDINKEIVLIHGDADSMVPFQISQDLATAISGVRLIPFAGMEHGFTDADDEDGIDPRSIENKLRIYKIIQDECT